jgi:hypothetical protein
MRTLIATALLAPSIAGACAQSACKRILSKKGTYVEPHYRSSPNSPVYDN